MREGRLIEVQGGGSSGAVVAAPVMSLHDCAVQRIDVIETFDSDERSKRERQRDRIGAAGDSPLAPILGRLSIAGSCPYGMIAAQHNN
jgi:hypothetical protein